MYQRSRRQRVRDELKAEVVKAKIYLKLPGGPWVSQLSGFRARTRNIYLERGSKSKGRLSNGLHVELKFGEWHYIPNN